MELVICYILGFVSIFTMILHEEISHLQKQNIDQRFILQNINWKDMLICGFIWFVFVILEFCYAIDFLWNGEES